MILSTGVLLNVITKLQVRSTYRIFQVVLQVLLMVTMSDWKDLLIMIMNCNPTLLQIMKANMKAFTGSTLAPA